MSTERTQPAEVVRRIRDEQPPAPPEAAAAQPPARELALTDDEQGVLADFRSIAQASGFGDSDAAALRIAVAEYVHLYAQFAQLQGLVSRGVLSRDNLLRAMRARRRALPHYTDVKSAAPGAAE